MHLSARPHRRGRQRSRIRRGLATVATLALGSALLAACSEASATPTLNWYINPDGVDTLTQIAADCSTDDYTIEIQLLPSSATDQRTQLARRLAAEDSSTDLMSLDPVFVPEFANADWLLEVPEDVASEISDGGDVLAGPVETVTWEDKIYAIPQWANTQVLWYRKSLADRAGLDMAQPVTWDQIIDAAADNNGTVGVQANRYEGYTVWLNALILGAGGEIVSDTEAGKDATVEVDSEAGRKAAEIVQRLVDSPAAQNDLTVANEGTVLGQMFPPDASAPGGAGEFMVNWTFVYKNFEPNPDVNDFTEEQFKDLGWARYPRTVPDTPSAPPLGGINIGVGAYSEHPEFAMEAAQCVTTTEAQTELAVTAGLMPSRSSAYDAPELTEAYPRDLLELFQTSVDEGGPRPKSAYYSLISSAIQARWHSPMSVDPDSTPEKSAQYLKDVLEGKALL